MQICWPHAFRIHLWMIYNNTSDTWKYKTKKSVKKRAMSYSRLYPMPKSGKIAINNDGGTFHGLRNSSPLFPATLLSAMLIPKAICASPCSSLISAWQNPTDHLHMPSMCLPENTAVYSLPEFHSLTGIITGPKVQRSSVPFIRLSSFARQAVLWRWDMLTVREKERKVRSWNRNQILDDPILALISAQNRDASK